MAEYNSTRFEFSVGEDAGKPVVIVQLSGTSRLMMSPSAALGVAGMIVRQAVRAAPGTSDERTILARMYAEMRALEAAPEPVPVVE